MENKKVLITGGAGFIGSNLARKLFSLGADVTVLVKYKSLIDNIRLSSIWDKIEVVETDLRNSDSLKQFNKMKYDVIFHLAAYNHVGDSFLHVNEAMLSNAVATANLLESGPDYERFIYTSTSEVYGYQDSVPFVEKNIPFPISPYSIGKYTGELYAKMKRHQTNKEIICIRPFNTFGPYQSDRAIIPELIIKCLKGDPIATTEGKQTREFNYVDNIVDGFIATALVEEVPDKVINIGSNQEIAIRDLVRKIHELTKSKSDLKIGALENRPTEIWRMCSDNTRAKNLLNWNPKISFEDGLKKTIGWYEKYLDAFYNPSSELNRL